MLATQYRPLPALSIPAQQINQAPVGNSLNIVRLLYPGLDFRANSLYIKRRLSYQEKLAIIPWSPKTPFTSHRSRRTPAWRLARNVNESQGRVSGCSELDLNQRPSGYEPVALPDWAILLNSKVYLKTHILLITLILRYIIGATSRTWTDHISLEG